MRISSLRWGIIWIGIGLFFLAINLEVLDSLVFPRLISLWPVLLIAIGIELIFRRTRLYFLALFSPLLIALAFIIAASGDFRFWNSIDFWKGWKSHDSNELTEIANIPLDSLAIEIELLIDSKESQVNFLSQNDNAVVIKASYQRRAPIVEHSKTENIHKITFEERSINRTTIFGLRRFQPRAEIEIRRDLPVSLDLATTAADAELNLEALTLKKFNLDMDCSSAQIKIGNILDSTAIILNGETGKLTLILPHNCGYTVKGNDGKSVELRTLLSERIKDKENLSGVNVTLELKSEFENLSVEIY